MKSEASDFVRAENRHCDISSEAKALLPHSLPVSCSERKKKLEGKEGNEKPRKGKRKKEKPGNETKIKRLEKDSNSILITRLWIFGPLS